MELLDNFVIAVFRCLINLIRPITSLIYELTNGSRRKVTVPPISDPILTLSACKLAQRIRSRELTCEAVVLAHINRIKEVNPFINAIVWERFDDALKEARDVDELIDSDPNNDSISIDRKPFLGVPTTVKESFGLVGGTQSVGLMARKNIVSSEDAECVKRLRAAGCIPLCLTNVSELCMWWESANYVNGRTKNPYDTRRIVGGSSGGEGALVSGGGAVVGLGSDIGGSIRMPAFFNGIFGHKATPYMIPNDGQFPNSHAGGRYFMLSGPMIRYAEDLIPMIRITAGPENTAKLLLRPSDPKPDISKLKFYYMESSGEETFCSPVDADIVKRLRNVVSFLRDDLGCSVEKVNLPKLKLSFALWAAKMKLAGEEKFAVQMGNGKHLNCYLELLKWCLCLSDHTFPAIGLGIFDSAAPSDKDRKLAKICDELQKEFIEMLAQDGVFLYPTHPTSAPYHNQPLFLMFNCAYTAIFNVLGLPTTQIPLGLDQKGLPIGIQAVANLDLDRLTLTVAEKLEERFGGWKEPGTV